MKKRYISIAIILTCVSILCLFMDKPKYIGNVIVIYGDPNDSIFFNNETLDPNQVEIYNGNLDENIIVTLTPEQFSEIDISDEVILWQSGIIEVRYTAMCSTCSI